MPPAIQGCWGSEQSQLAAMRRASVQFDWPPGRLAQMEQRSISEVWSMFYNFVICAQLAVLTFWSLLTCAQSISGEREMRTWDFQRATRLGSGELLLGKLFGEPVLAYFIVLCCLPLTVVAGLWGHAGWRNIASAYLLIFSGSLFIGLTGLWLSNQFASRSRGIGLIGTFGLYIIFGLASQLTKDSNFPGFSALTPLAGLSPLLDRKEHGASAMVFGHALPLVLLSLLLYATFGSWFFLALLRTLKKDYDQMQPLSRRQGVGCAAFVNFTMYAFFFPLPWDRMDAIGFVKFMVGVNGLVLFVMGLGMLSSGERLKIWWQTKRAIRSELSDNGLAWPWIAISVVLGYGLLVFGMFSWKELVGFDHGALLFGLMLYVVVGVFVTRDILFLQWCRLTNLRSPVLKGLLYVGLYYVATVVLGTVLSITSEARARAIYSLTTPGGAFYWRPNAPINKDFLLIQICGGLIVQVLAIFLLLSAVRSRLSVSNTSRTA